MKLLDVLAPHFSSKSRSRGREYYDEGAVEITLQSPTLVVAAVEGTITYEVDIAQTRSTVVMWCSCPHFEDRNPCKHLWATLLTIAEDLKTGEWQQIGQRTPRFDYNATFDFENVETETEPGAARASTAKKSSRLSRPRFEFVRPHPRYRTPPPEPPWKEQLATLRSAILYRGRFLDDSRKGQASERIHYVLDAYGSRSTGALPTQLCGSRRKKPGQWTAPKPTQVASTAIAAFPDPDDRRILHMLDEAMSVRQMEYVGYGLPAAASTPVLSNLIVRPVIGRAVLPLICATQRMMLDPQLLEGTNAESVGLRWDDGGEWTFKVAIEPGGQPGVDEPPKQYRVAGVFVRGDERRAIEDTAIVTSDFVVFRDSIAPIAHVDSVEWLNLFNAGDAVAVPAKDVDALFETLLSMPELPPLDLRRRGAVARRSSAPCCSTTAE
jgi:hypothetical protein